MQTIKQRKIPAKIIPSDYVNVDTGELLSSVVNGNVSLQTREKTEHIVLNSTEYVTFDSAAVMFLTQHLNNADVGKVFQISNMVKGDCSVVCQNNNHPHTPETLSNILEMNLNKFYEFIRKLVKKNILSYCVCAPSGHLQKIYMLNPFVARKRKNINCELLHFFRDVTKDGEIKD